MTRFHLAKVAALLATAALVSSSVHADELRTMISQAPGPVADVLSQVMLNPQPLPPKARIIGSQTLQSGQLQTAAPATKVVPLPVDSTNMYGLVQLAPNTAGISPETMREAGAVQDPFAALNLPGLSLETMQRGAVSPLAAMNSLNVQTLTQR